MTTYLYIGIFFQIISDKNSTENDLSFAHDVFRFSKMLWVSHIWSNLGFLFEIDWTIIVHADNDVKPDDTCGLYKGDMLGLSNTELAWLTSGYFEISPCNV